MAKDPAFLFYSSDFLSGIADLTMEERGQYITLLCLQHQKGNLTEKTIKISVPNISLDVLSKFTKDEDGNFFNKRLSDEVLKRQEHSKRQRDNVLKRWNKVENTDTNVDTKTIPKQYDGITVVIPLENENENEDVNKNIDVINNKGEDLKKIPSLLDFTSYALENDPTIEIQSLRLKYESWKVAGWKAGKDLKPIKNWKTTLLNTIPYLTKSTQPTISKNEQRFNKFQEASDGAAAIIRAKYGIEEDS